MPHYEDSLIEVHKVVVGPMDNNVYVIRSKGTGDAVLIDAANEHELLLQMCRDLGVRKVLETHGHWDHIQAVPAVRDAGTKSRSPPPTPGCSPPTTSSSRTTP